MNINVVMTKLFYQYLRKRNIDCVLDIDLIRFSDEQWDKSGCYFLIEHDGSVWFHCFAWLHDKSYVEKDKLVPNDGLIVLADYYAFVTDFLKLERKQMSLFEL